MSLKNKIYIKKAKQLKFTSDFFCYFLHFKQALFALDHTYM